MTSFAYPPAMAAQHFDMFSTDSCNDFSATSQSFQTSTSMFEGPFMSTIDSFPAGPAYADVPRSQDAFRFNVDASVAPMGNGQAGYSPAHSPAEHMPPPPHLSTSSESGASVHSTSSSAMGSPHMHPQYQTEAWNNLLPNSMSIGSQEPFYSTGVDQDAIVANKLPGYVDPSILNPFPSPLPFNYPEMTTAPSPLVFDQPPSPAPSQTSGQGQSTKVKTSPHQSPYLQTHHYHPYPYPLDRRPSTSSLHSRNSQSTGRSPSYEMDEVDREKGLCPIPDCGRVFKDLKAHMLTHQNERPEKCPIQTCEYHTKGFARKYDKNRHTLTHYKGTMVCGFCPGSGSAAEKSFNRADVFKRHLTSVHGVEQTPPNSRKKSPSASKKTGGASQSQTAGTCSTCSVTFANPQEFYEHIDDCVLRVVQQIDPAEAINQKHLAAVSDDKHVQETLDKHHLTDSAEYSAQSFDEEEDDEDDDIENDDVNDTTYGSKNPRSGKGTIKAGSGSQHLAGGASANSNRVSKVSGGRRGRAGLTYSKGGVPMHGGAGSTVMSRNGGKKRKNYPDSWGVSPEKMKMRKRVLCVYDGPRRLWKDDMMLDAEYEVRVTLPGSDGRNYVTDLDVQTLKRAEALHGATDEERGPWVPDNILDIDVADELML